MVTRLHTATTTCTAVLPRPIAITGRTVTWQRRTASSSGKSRNASNTRPYIAGSRGRTPTIINPPPTGTATAVDWTITRTGRPAGWPATPCDFSRSAALIRSRVRAHASRAAVAAKIAMIHSRLQNSPSWYRYRSSPDLSSFLPRCYPSVTRISYANVAKRQ